jgi:pimeloyl-ACP methyl ester carboxylesterase
MARPRTRLLLAPAAVGGAAAVAGVVAAGRAERRRLLHDPEYVELSRPLRGREHTVVSADGTGLHVEVFGSETAPTLVLLHGWTCALRFWHPQIVELSRDFRVVALDLRGHGASRPPRGGAFTSEALADDLSAVLTACLPPGERAVLAGHSMGAMAIVAWAARHPEELERVAGAVLISTGIGDLVVESLLVPLPRSLVRTRRLLAAGLLGSSLPWPRSLRAIALPAVRRVALSPGATAAQVGFCHDVVSACRAQPRAAWGRMLATLDLRAAVERLCIPALVMVGERDRLTPPPHARRLQRTLPEPVGLVVVPGAGHMLPVEAADEVNRQVREFATEVLEAAGGGVPGSGAPGAAPAGRPAAPPDAPVSPRT